MTTPERLYPSIPEATPEELGYDIEDAYRFWLPINPTANICGALRIAAHHARRAAELERRLAEAEQSAGLANVLRRFEAYSERHQGRYVLSVSDAGWSIWDVVHEHDDPDLWCIPIADLARVLGAWLDQQEGKANG